MKKSINKILISITGIITFITAPSIILLINNSKEKVEDINVSLLNNENIEKTLPTTSEKILTRKIADELGWSTKEDITLNDWKTQAPNVTSTPGYSSDPKSVSPWKNNNVIKTIQIPKTFIEFGDDAFKWAENLESITFEPESALMKIGDYFIEATKVQSIVIPDWVTLIGSKCFNDSKLVSISLPKPLMNKTIGLTPTQVSQAIYRPTATAIISDKNVGAPDNDKLTSDVSDDWIRKYIFDNLIEGRRPDGFSVNDVIIDQVQRGDDGVIKFKATLKTYINNKGELSTNNFIAVIVTLAGFKSTTVSPILKPTTIKFGSTLVPDQNGVTTADYTDTQIRTFVFNNLIGGDKPEGFTKENIILNNVSRDNGVIKFKVALNLFINDSGQIATTGFAPVDVKLVGFDNNPVVPGLTPTSIDKGNYFIPDHFEILSNNYTETQIKEYIFQPDNSVIKGNRPHNFSVNNIILSNIIRDNGIITVQVSLDSFINNSGEESTSGFTPVEIVLTGFKSDIKPSPQKNNTPIIVGAVVGSIIAVIIIAGGVYWWMRKNKNKEFEQIDENEEYSDDQYYDPQE